MSADEIGKLDEDSLITSSVKEFERMVRMAAISELAYNLDTWSQSSEPAVQALCTVALERLQNLINRLIGPEIMSEEGISEIIKRSISRLEAAERQRKVVLS